MMRIVLGIAIGVILGLLLFDALANYPAEERE